MKQSMRSQGEKRPYHSQRRQHQAEETRQHILAAARKLLESRGYARMTLEAVAEAAGVSPKTVSVVIGSKTAILIELVTELVNPDTFDTRIQYLLDQLRTIQEPMRSLELVVRI